LIYSVLARKKLVIASEAKQSRRKSRPEKIASPAFVGLAMTNIGRRSEYIREF